MSDGTAPLPLHDVAVVGGGPVGLLVACLLAARGLDVVVLEKRTHPGGRMRAFGIHPPGLAALDAAGVGAAVRESAACIRTGIALSRGRELGRISLATAPVRSLPQCDTEALLEARLDDLAPDALHRGAAVTALRDLGTTVELGVERDDGSRTTFMARYVIGADGVRSTVRDLLGIDWLSRGTGRTYAMVDVSDQSAPPDTALLHLEPAGVVESFPLGGGDRRWVVHIDGCADALDEQTFASLVKARTSTFLDPSVLPVPSVFTARQRIARSFIRGRVLLVGDAAHEISPIGGLGMNLGWRDAVHLDRALARSLAADAPGALRAYARMRRAAAMVAMRQAAFNMSMGAPTHGFRLRLRLRNGLVRALTTRPFAGGLAAAFTMRWL